jgi:DNA gyrase subunit B
LYANASAPAISGVALETAVKDYYQINSIIERLSKKFNLALMQAVSRSVPMNNLKDTKKFKTWCAQIQQLLEQDLTPAQKHTVVFNEKTQEVEHTLTVYGVDTDTDYLGKAFFNSDDYKTIKEFSEEIESVFSEESFVEKKGKEVKAKNFTQVVNFLMDDAKKGQSFQRYKGLGEMNPEQLWETTMDPENRILLKVKIEDAIVADEVFSTLMGDEVEPRRDFIEKNALSVDNLDF